MIEINFGALKVGTIFICKDSDCPLHYNKLFMKTEQIWDSVNIIKNVVELSPGAGQIYCFSNMCVELA